MGAFFDDLKGRIVSAALLFFPRLFPRLAGPHSVGVLRARLSESVFAQISYPAVKGTGATARYLRRPVAKGLADYLKMRSILFSPLTIARHPCEFEALPEHCEEKWPVAVFSHGLGGCAEMYSLFNAQLASHGVVVVALEHEDGSGCFAQAIDSEEVILYKRPSFKYNRENVVGFRAPFLEQRCGEVRSAVSALQSVAARGASDCAQLAALCASADLSRVHLVGHSFGGVTAVLAAQQPMDVPVASVALFDPWAFSLPDDALRRGVDVPVATVLSEVWTNGPEVDTTKQLLASCTTLKQCFAAPGTRHTSFSDAPCWYPGLLTRRFGIRGKEEPLHLLHEAMAMVPA